MGMKGAASNKILRNSKKVMVCFVGRSIQSLGPLKHRNFYKKNEIMLLLDVNVHNFGNVLNGMPIAFLQDNF